MSWIWYADRGTALVAITAMWLAVMTGIAYKSRAAKSLHTPVSVVAATALLAHVTIGTFDAWLVLSTQVPHPAYSDAYFVVGLLVGLSALVLTVVSILAFADAKKFERPWDPKTVHLLAYGGLVFGLVHAAAIGTDAATTLRPAFIAATVLSLYALAFRYFTRPKAPTDHPPGGPSGSSETR